MEFWHGRPDRLHERKRFRRTEDGWEVALLYP
ncbi:MAG: pyridoxine 5'-phosphate oxidase C-terminal domain-containing protein [bacterium]